ncbi:restriction endonuclease subunit S [Pectinatus frisingensis]|uniref:restriction endonuclease subunit S n=1 Tax=Pectinatus frisingensis TaxID=865 RepID=UPI0018C60C98|nr:restriction endonuclease subunit S [Pectinatus frisingensis]
MEKKAKVPKLRFPGFTDAWEQRKLGEISEKITTKNSNLEYMETFTNSAEHGIISQRDFFDKDISNKDSLDGYYIVQDDDFVYNPRISTTAPVGPIKRNKLGRTGVMSPLYYVFKTHDIDNTFLEKYFSTTGWHGFMYLNGDSGARSDRFAIKDAVLREMPVPYPSLAEQQKIGEFLEQFDNLITLHQRKLTHLQAKKKSLLQKMFPKKGECFPELRFPGFTDAWEQRKLDLITDVRDGTHASPQYVVDGHPFVTSKNVKEGYINYDDIQFISDLDFEEINKRSKVDINDILMGMIGTIGNIAIVRENPDFAIKNVALIKDTGDVFYRYLYYCLQSKKVVNQLSENLDGGTQKFIALNKVRNLNIPLPSKKEQHKIGNYFENLDNLITLHQRKLTHLKTQKKALLQQMFV